MNSDFEDFHRRQDDGWREHNRTMRLTIIVVAIFWLAVLGVGTWAVVELVQWVTAK